jgi:heat-inducible transcriptional repressor
MLSQRARRILLAAVSDYIETGEPVSSRAMCQRHGLDLSPASVRAVFAELEAAGYLAKPHTSAGRVPTESGFKLFAESTLVSSERAAAASSEIERRYSTVEPGLDALMRHTVKVLAELTGAASVVRPPPSETWVLRELRFIWLKRAEVLAVIVAANGAVQNRVMRIEDAPSPAELERINNLLRERIEGRTLAEVRSHIARDLEHGRAVHDRFSRRALELGQEALNATPPGDEVLIEGAAQLIERPEFANLDRTRQVVRALEDQCMLLDLLDRTLQTPGIQVVIGSAENEMGSDLSLVAATFGLGAVGVIGSTRMDYSQVVPLVRHTALRLAKMLRGDGKN